MRSWLWGCLLGTALVLAACGGKVIVDGLPEEGIGGAGGGSMTTSGSSSTKSSSTGNTSTGGFTTSAVSTGTGGALMACIGKPCGAACTVCNNIECIQGKCDSFGICVPNQPSCP